MSNEQHDNNGVRFIGGRSPTLRSTNLQFATLILLQLCSTPYGPVSKALEKISMSLRKYIEEKYSSRIFDHGLFYLFEGALRFELSTGGDAIEMFSVAYQKSQEILSEIFKSETSVVVCWTFYGKSRFSTSLSLFRDFYDLGVKIPKVREMWSVEDEEEHEFYRHFILFELDSKYIRNLIWGAIAQDMGVRPRLPGSVYIYGKRNGILAQPYDDRGMDLVAEKGKSLGFVYKMYNHYLLDDDREKMDRVYKDF